MKSLTFKEFIDGKYVDDDDYAIYIVKNNADVLYVGISRDNIYNRWFTAEHSHIVRTANGTAIRGNSAIGQAIVENLPKSLEWTVILLTEAECIERLGDRSPCKSEYDNNALTKLERYLISKLQPLFNATHNTQQPIGNYINQDLTTAPCDVLGLRLYQ
jgi:hypothetical protein